MQAAAAVTTQSSNLAKSLLTPFEPLWYRLATAEGWSARIHQRRVREGVETSMRRFGRITGLAAVCALVLATASWGAEEAGASFRGRGPRAALFPRPAKLSQRIDFWKRIFTQFDAHQVVIHDTKYVDKIYTVLDLKGARNKEEIDAASTAEKKRLRAILLKLDKRGNEAEGRGARERAIVQLFRDVDAPRKYRAAADRLRAQTGLRARFAEGIRVSRRYLPEMERIFRAAGLPVELTRLPLIESTFDVHAYSRRGAAGRELLCLRN